MNVSMELHGTVTSRGIAIGRIKHFAPFVPNHAHTYIPPEETEPALRRIDAARETAKAELERLAAAASANAQGTGEIFQAHLMIAEDEEVSQMIRELVEQEHYAPEWAVESAFNTFAELFDGMDDALIRERAADMRDVCTRMLRCLAGKAEVTLAGLEEPVILVAEDLLPSDTVALDPKMVLGIITEKGGATSHSAILARSYGIPALCGVRDARTLLPDGAVAVLDAVDGVALLQPDAEQAAAYQKKRRVFLRDRQIEQQYQAQPARTADGQHIDIEANIGSPEDAAAASFADGVGLFRTEFLYMEQPALPDEQQQFTAYRKVLETFAGKPVTIRTLDIGGDKSLPCMELPNEDNPFLGQRALRLCFAKPEIFRTQLRALVRASAYGQLWLMFPMVGSMDDIFRAKHILQEVCGELDQEGIPRGADMKVGVMIEIPALAWIADLVAEEVDFACVGTNDLCQYLTAADRLNPNVSAYYQNYHPAMFRAMRSIISAFNAAKKPVCICGEAGGDPAFAAALIGMGMRRLSMSQTQIARMKHVISTLDTAAAADAAARVCEVRTAAEAERLLNELIQTQMKQRRKEG